MFFRCPFNYFQCYNPYKDDFEGFERDSTWPKSDSPWPKESDNPWPKESEYGFPVDYKEHCKKNCIAMSFNQKLDIANSCQGYTTFMCFYPRFEDYSGFWKINGVQKDNNDNYFVSVEDDKGRLEVFNIRNIKCINPCR